MSKLAHSSTEHMAEIERRRCEDELGPGSVTKCPRCEEFYVESDVCPSCGEINSPWADLQKRLAHASDCAVHNAPAYEPGACNCGGRGQR